MRLEFSVPYAVPIFFGRNFFSSDSQELKSFLGDRGHQLFFAIDGHVADAWPNLIPSIEIYFKDHPNIKIGEPFITPGGESCKSLEQFQNLLKFLADQKADRHSYVIAIGGGAFLDLCGFACATFHRGIRHIRFPTTVLAQNDSGIGVKNGINHFAQKNFLGTFAPPEAVFCDFNFLKTLHERDLRAGMAEAVKVALIKDKEFFLWFEENASRLAAFDPSCLETLIKRCAELHATHIMSSGDPFERGSSRPLDFGHWLAHKLEILSDYQIRHGEAVAVGMAVDTYYSYLKGFLDSASCQRAFDLLKNLGFKLSYESLFSVKESGHLRILDGLEDFRIHLGGELSLPMLTNIGETLEVHEVDESLMAKAIHHLKESDRLT